MKSSNKFRIYGAGIVNSNCDWEWQGTVSANNLVEAKRLLVQFKKEHGLKGSCEVTNFGMTNFTKRKPGVYNSMILG